MALKVWLPLNGSLENKGISDYSINIFRGHEIYNDAGKIGKCFYSNGVNTIKILNIIPDFYNYTGYSLCAWFYIESQNTSHNGSAIISGGNWNSQVLNLAVSDWSTDHYTRLRISGTNWNRTYSYNFNKNTWYHVVVSSDENKTYAYVNGTLLGDTATGFLPTSIEGNDICIGGATYYAGMQFFGRINDVRIYNHCLSQKEIKEISQGLVLHYKLDGFSGGAGDNLLPNTSFNGISQKYTLNRGTEGGFMYTPISVNRSTLYTISCYLRGNANMTLYRICSGGNEATPWVNRNDMSETEYKYFSITFTSPAAKDISQIYICTRYGTSNSQVGDWFEIKPYSLKMEQGFIATPWIPTLSEMGIDTTKVPDSSGYGNDGVITGTLEIEQNNFDGRYQIATKFPTNNCYIKLPAITYSNFGSSYTFTWWEYMTTVNNGPMPWGFSNGNRLNCYHITNLCWNTGDGSSNPFTPVKPAASLVDNKWHFMAITGDGTNVNLYIDGVYVAKATTWKPLTGTQIYISGWDTGTSYSMVSNKMSDFRIYATVLNAEDIAILYHTPLQIDNMQNMHGFEFTENKTKQSIGQNGQIMNNSLIKTYLVNNFSETNTITDWTFTSPTISNGIVTTTGTAPTITSKTFTVNPDDIIVVKFTLSMPTPSTSTSGQGLFLGTQASTNTNRYNFNFTTKTWGAAQSNTSSSWNTYFLNGYNSTNIVTIQSYILGSNVDINNVPAAKCSLSSISSTNAIQLTSGTTTHIRAGYNNGNSTMVIKLYDFEIYNLKENGFCEIDNVHIGKGFYQANIFIEK